MLRLSPVAKEIRDHLIVHSGSVDDALSKGCAEIYWRELRMRELERALLEAEHNASWGERRGRFMVRTGGPLPARQPKPQMPDPVCDSWIKTGATGDAS